MEMKEKIERIIDHILKGHIRITRRDVVLKTPAESAVITGRIKVTLEDVVTGEVEIHESTNLIVTAGKNMIAARLAGEANNCNITYGAVGTDNTAPVVGNTTLGTELARKVLASISRSGNVISCTTFFSTSEAVGSIEEIGMFGEAGSVTPDSGTMLNHLLLSFTKSGSQTMSIQGTFTIN